MSVFRLITAAKKQIIRGRLLIQCELHEREIPPEKLLCWLISLLAFLRRRGKKWKLKGEQGCSEPIVAGLAAIGSQWGPASRGLIWEFTGASRISLRHISLMNLNTAWIRSFYTSKLLFCRQLLGIATGTKRRPFVVCLLSAEAAHIAATRRADFVFDFKIVRMLLDVYLFQLIWHKKNKITNIFALGRKGGWVFNILFPSHCR